MAQGIILVLGGTGTIGQPVVCRLQECGYQVRVLSRTPSRAQGLFDEAVEVVGGDVLIPCDLQAALGGGCDGLHISIATANEGACVRQILKSAAACGVRHITYVSGTSVREENSWFPPIQEKLTAEQALQESGIPFTILRPTWFMEMIPNFTRHGRPTLIGKHPPVFRWIAAEDFARMVVNAYLRGADNRTLTIHGPEALSLADALERYRAAIRPDLGSTIRVPFWLAKALAALTRNEDLKYVSRLLAYFGKVGEPGDPTEANQLLGSPAITVDAWLADQRVDSQLAIKKT